MKTTQEFLFNGEPVTITETDEGELEISGDAFIYELVSLGFRPGRNDSPERIAEILKHIPETFRQDFWDGYFGK